MPKAGEIVFSSLWELVSTALKQLRLASGKSVYLTRDDSELYSFFYKMQQEFGEDFPELGRVHFQTAGAFPWSKDISDMLWDLYHLEDVVFVGDYMEISPNRASRKMVKELLDKTFRLDDVACYRFMEFTSRFETLVRQPPGFR